MFTSYLGTYFEYLEPYFHLVELDSDLKHNLLGEQFAVRILYVHRNNN